MASMTVTLELCDEDRARLDRFINLMDGFKPDTPEIMEKKLNLPEQEAPKQEAPEPNATMADVQALVRKLAAPSTGKRDAARDIVRKYAERVVEIPEDKLADVYQELTALERGE